MLKSYGFLEHLKKAYQVPSMVHGPQILYGDENFFYKFNTKKCNGLVFRSRSLLLVAFSQFYRIYLLSSGPNAIQDVLVDICLCALVATCCIGAGERQRVVGKYAEK